MNNLLVNGHLFILNISNGRIYLALEKSNNKLSVPKISYEGKDSIDSCIKKYLKDNIKISCININSCHVYSKNNVIDIIYVITTKDYELNDGYKYYEINELNQKLVSKDVERYLIDNVKKMSFIKEVYAKEFSLRELQDLIESVYKVKLDRRNFRKRLLNLGIINETDDIRKRISNGRPNKLYKFNEEKDEYLI